MNFKPFNKHILIKPIEQEEDKEAPLFVIPDEYKPAKSPYMIAEVLEMAADCTIPILHGERIVVERTVVQEIKVDLETIYVVKENYVYGRLMNEVDN